MVLAGDGFGGKFHAEKRPPTLPEASRGKDSYLNTAGRQGK